MTECISCRILAGGKRISPCEPIFDGPNWVVEHAYPVKVAGWLVLYPRRHVMALHELKVDEYEELSNILDRLSRALHGETGCLKEYLAFVAETPGFHLHGHMVPRAADMPEAVRGGRAFALLEGVSEADGIPVEQVKATCARLRDKMNRAEAVR